MMSDSEREMMSRPFHAPVFQERADIRTETAMGVGVPGRRNRSCDGFAFRDDEFEFSIRFTLMLSMVIGPVLILNSTPAPLPGFPWYFFRLRSTGLRSAMFK